MDAIKSLDYVEVITALLCDVQTLHSNVFTSSDLRKTRKKVLARVSHEGIGFLTKTLPRLGKALDKALAETDPLDSNKLGFKTLPDSKLPRFLGELFQRVLSKDGTVLHDADVTCVNSLRQVLYLFYKLELNSEPELEQHVINRFIQTEDEVTKSSLLFAEIAKGVNEMGWNYLKGVRPLWVANTICAARDTLSKVFRSFDHMDIYPRHGPGAVSTKEKLWEKYHWKDIPARITDVYPLDAYFYASIGHVCDTYPDFPNQEGVEPFARVCLVPKDSRGPRLISCEPLVFQWIQQGLSNALVKHIESHPLTREGVRFTDQQPNQIAALYGSLTGKYATLDLNDASDRVSLGLVRLLFPEPLLGALLACRSLGTTLPDGTTLTLNKYAPMGSALCFPVLSLVVWSLIVSGLKVICKDVDVKDVYVYGDDVIVPTKYAEHAMSILTVFGLKVNRDKSCTKGFFRESCGMDAFRGIEVTPVRFRTPWTSLRRPDAFTSWIKYANSMYERKYFHCYDVIVSRLCRIYSGIPTKSVLNHAYSLYEVPDNYSRLRQRWNPDLQRLEFRVLDVAAVKAKRTIDGWSMLLRYFSEGTAAERSSSLLNEEPRKNRGVEGDVFRPFRVREYTYRKRACLRYRWVSPDGQECTSCSTCRNVCRLSKRHHVHNRRGLSLECPERTSF